MRAPFLKNQQENFKNHDSRLHLQPKKGIRYPDNATYALKRRLIVPKWWIESILFTSGKKYAWYDAFITEHFDKKIYEYFKVTGVNMFFMLFLWNEIIRNFFSDENQHNKKIKLDLTPFFVGTEKQKTSILKKIEENLIKPIIVHELKQIEDSKSVVPEKQGYLNLFKKVHLVQDVDGIWLTLDFAQNPLNAFGSPEVKPKKHTFKDCFVTINPTLFYAMGSRVSLKKALNGLFLEYNKQNEDLDPSHTSFDLDDEKILPFHAYASATAESWYDQGILDSSSTPPSTKISMLKRLQKTVKDDENSSFLFVWNLSSQSREARNFEAGLSKQLNDKRQNSKRQLFFEPPKDELSEVRTTNIPTPKLKNEIKLPQPPIVPQPVFGVPKTEKNTEILNTKETHLNSDALSTQTLPASEANKTLAMPRFMKQQQPKPNFHDFSERELTIFVARFYETLNPKQKQMFESERRSMTREQFRAFMIPILQRTHATLPT